MSGNERFGGGSELTDRCVPLAAVIYWRLLQNQQETVGELAYGISADGTINPDSVTAAIAEMTDAGILSVDAMTAEVTFRKQFPFN